MFVRTRILAAVMPAMLVLGGAASLANAQVVATDTASNFARDRNVSVRERPRPGYDALGIRTGAFLIYPRLDANVYYDDNIYATPSDTTSDVVYQIEPQVTVSSNWNRNALSLFAGSVISRYGDHGTENTDTYQVGGNGRLDVVRGTSLSGGGDYQYLAEPRTSPTAPTAAAKPVRYDLGEFNVGGVSELNRLRLVLRVNYQNYNYMNTVTTGGAPLIQNTRDRDQWAETVRAEYAISPDTAVYVAGILNQVNYKLVTPSFTGAAPFQRNSTGYTAAVGANFDLTNVIRGEVQVGYLTQSYNDPRFKDTGSVALSAAVDWFPTQMTTVNITANRNVQEAVVVGSSGFVATNVGVRIDHELLRNIILTAQGGYGRDDYRGVDRKDDLYNAGLSATYFMNHNIGFTAGYSYQSLNSKGTDANPNYRDNRVTGTITLQF